MRVTPLAIAAVMSVTPATAQQVSSTGIRSLTDGFLVTSEDVTTCPYKLINSVSVNMRAKSYSPKELQPEAIAAQLRKAARKINADAVVLVTVGQTHMTMTSLRSTPVTGRAIKYVNSACRVTS